MMTVLTFMALLVCVKTASLWLLAMAIQRNQLLNIIVNTESPGSLAEAESFFWSEHWLMGPGETQLLVNIAKNDFFIKK